MTVKKNIRNSPKKRDENRVEGIGEERQYFFQNRRLWFKSSFSFSPQEYLVALGILQ
jgi:hypothetical protein